MVGTAHPRDEPILGLERFLLGVRRFLPDLKGILPYMRWPIFSLRGSFQDLEWISKAHYRAEGPLPRLSDHSMHDSEPLQA